jgi:manganese/zinc/iron transport system permease protein
MNALRVVAFTGLWPEWSDLIHVAFLRDYNTRLVILTTAALGLACGMIGTFLLLRKRSLIGDAISHATLPGIVAAFLAMVALGGEGKWLPGLLTGAALTGLLGCGLVLLVRGLTRIKDDAAMGIVLSVFFGAGIALLAMIQNMPGGSKAGLESFIYGKTASIVAADFQLLACVSAIVVLLSILFFKEFRLLCFDEQFARSQGLPVVSLDVVLMGLVTAMTVAGLQAVGLILIIAFLITPAAAARFWTERTGWMLGLSGMLGAASGWAGASLSALAPRLPAGAIIVLVAALIFLVSMLVGSSRGVLLSLTRRFAMEKRMWRQHLLRAMFELMETHALPDEVLQRPQPVAFTELLARRTWSRRDLTRLVRQAWREDLVEKPDGDFVQLTVPGLHQARRVTRNHRLWEMYLIRYADIAPSHVDRDADAVEHILGEATVRELEHALAGESICPPPAPMPNSSHPLQPDRAKGAAR